jgi:hypothetical protein
MISGELALRHARAIKFTGYSIRELSMDEYRDYLMEMVREAELAGLREESNRLCSRILIFTLKVALCIAALPLLAIIGVFGIIGWACKW